MKKWRDYTRIEYKDTDIAYLAGIIDGEGSIYIGNFSCNPITQLPYYQTNIQVTNTDTDLIYWLQKTFGGLVNNKTHEKTARPRKKAYVWTISGERLEHICELILPFSKGTKRKQVEVMIKMRATFRVKTSRSELGKPRLPNEVRELRQSLMNEMRNLHARTFSYKSHGHLPRVAMPPVLEEV